MPDVLSNIHHWISAMNLEVAWSSGPEQNLQNWMFSMRIFLIDQRELVRKISFYQLKLIWDRI